MSVGIHGYIQAFPRHSNFFLVQDDFNLFSLNDNVCLSHKVREPPDDLINLVFQEESSLEFKLVDVNHNVAGLDTLVIKEHEIEYIYSISVKVNIRVYVRTYILHIHKGTCTQARTCSIRKARTNHAPAHTRM